MVTSAVEGDCADRSARHPWPLVERADQARAVRTVTHDRLSIAIVGAPGVGKTAFARAVAERARHDSAGVRTAVVAIEPGPHESGMPFAAAAGALAELPAEAGIRPLEADEAIRRAAAVGDAELLIRVDAADRLDALTARYLSWLVHERHARLVLTCRDFTAVPEPIRALWVDDLLVRLDLLPLNLRETERAVAEYLGAPLEAASLDRLHRATQGNPLYLREVVRAGRASGALEQTTTGWYWRGRITASASLVDMYRSELGSMPTDVRDVIDIVALADPIPLSRLLDLVEDTHLDRTSATGMIRVEADSSHDGTPVVRPANPLLGEVVRELVPVARRTRFFARANAFRAHADANAAPAARLRATLWALECGIVPAVSDLLDAAQIANGLQEYESAVTLATAARAASPTNPAEAVAALVLRAIAITFHRGREAARSDATRAWAEARANPALVGDALIVEAVEILANLRQFHDDDVDAALALVDEAAQLVGDDARERLRTLRMAHEGWGGRFASVLEETDKSGMLTGPVPLPYLTLAPCSIIALAIAGRVPEALRLADASLATAIEHVQDAPWSVGEIMSLSHQVHMWAGLVDDLPTHVSPFRSNPFFKYDFTLELLAEGNLAIAQRRWEDARKAFTAAAERFTAMDHGGFSAYAWSRLALAHAMLGDTSAASIALERAQSTPLRGMRITAEEIPSTNAVTEWLLGRPIALEHATQITERSIASGAWLPALFGVLLQMRIHEELGHDVSRLARQARAIAPRVQTPVAAAVTAMIDAERAGDQPAARAARSMLARAGYPRNISTAIRPALTRREHEVAVLAADGASNREIASRLGVSVRTVDAHISRVFAKWGLHARSELRELL